MENARHDKMMIIVMVVVSIIISYFFTMTIILRKNFTHQRNKLYQSLLMGAWMAVVMVLLKLYVEKKLTKNYMILLVCTIVVIIVVTYAIRQQQTINQDQFMLGMIEHHQMAIDMALLVEPKVTDPRLSNIVTNIISSQNSEIDQMYEILSSRRVDNNILSNLI